MNKLVAHCFSLFTISLIILSGCSKSTNVSKENNKKNTLEDLIKDSSEIENSLKSSDYKNISVVDKFSLNVPDAESVSTFTLTKKSKMKTEDIMDYLNDVIPHIIDESVDLNNELRFMSDSIPSNDTLSYPKSLPLLSDYKEKNVADINTYVLGNKNYYLELYSNGTLNSLNDGKAQKEDGIEKDCAGLYFATENHKIEKCYDNANSNDEYKLLDRSISISECANNVENYISDYFSLNSNTELKPVVCSAKAISMKDDVYGLSFSITCSYNDIIFDTYITETDGSFTEKSFSNANRKQFNLMPGLAFVLTSDKINNYNDYSRTYDINDAKEFNELMSPVDALEICSSSLSSNVLFEVSSCELKYVSYYINDDASNLNVYPVWRFQAYNTNDNLNYVLYVNTLDGSFEYYTY